MLRPKMCWLPPPPRQADPDACAQGTQPRLRGQRVRAWPSASPGRQSGRALGPGTERKALVPAHGDNGTLGLASAKRIRDDLPGPENEQGRAAMHTRPIYSTGAVIAFACMLATGCGAATRTVTVTKTITRTTTQTVTKTVTKHAPAPVSSTSGSSAAVGASSSQPSASSGGSTLSVHDFNGDTLSVKANGIIDPATPASQYVSPAAGSRFVAVEVTLSNTGAGTISSDVNTNMTVIGSDGQDYTPQFAPVSDCTNFSNGTYSLLQGDSERGCAIFQLPDGVKVGSMQFSLGDGTVQFNNG